MINNKLEIIKNRQIVTLIIENFTDYEYKQNISTWVMFCYYLAFRNNYNYFIILKIKLKL